MVVIVYGMLLQWGYIMKIRELITLLQQFNENSTIYMINTDDNGTQHAKDIKESNFINMSCDIVGIFDDTENSLEI